MKPAMILGFLLLPWGFPAGGHLAAIGAEALADEEDDMETITVTGRGGGSGGRGTGTAGTGSLNPATADPLGDRELGPDDYAESQPCGDGSTDPNCTCADGEEKMLYLDMFFCRQPPPPPPPPCGDGSPDRRCTCPEGEDSE